MKNSRINLPTDKMPIIRIAPVCNGKIYVTPHFSEHQENGYLDLPIEEKVEHVSVKSDKIIRKLKEKYHTHISSSMTPRFSVQYQSEAHNGNTAYLYILPLKEENEIQFHEGKFITAEDIVNHPDRYGHNLQKESELLGMAAELWNDFHIEYP